MSKKLDPGTYYPAGNYSCRFCPYVCQLNLERWPSEKEPGMECHGLMEFRGVTLESRSGIEEEFGEHWHEWRNKVKI